MPTPRAFEVGERIALCSSGPSVIQTHPFPGKLTFEEANELRRLHRGGARLVELAERYKIAKASASAIIHFHSHIPAGLLRIHLPEPDRDLLDELAEDWEIPVESVAAEILVEALHSREW